MRHSNTPRFNLFTQAHTHTNRQMHTYLPSSTVCAHNNGNIVNICGYDEREKKDRDSDPDYASFIF